MKLNQRVVCVDGFSLSIQRNEYAYCDLRFDDSDYVSFEIGYPSDLEPLLMEYVENPDKPTETVYGYVPLTVVLEVLEKHGGIKRGELPYFPGHTRPIHEIVSRLNEAN